MESLNNINNISEPIDVYKIRITLRLTQQGLADLLNISVSTVEAWEQQKKDKNIPLRKPNGPSETLLRLLEKYPEKMIQLLKNL